MIEGKRILLTGGAGFIGTALARQLVEHNDIVVLDNEHRNALKDSDIAGHKRLDFRRGDVLDFAAVRQAMAGCHIVVHLAAIAGVDTVMRMPVTCMKVAMIGTYHVLEAALQEKQIERLIDFSTSEVFGTYAYKVREGDVTTLGALGEARWTYAVSKLATEHMAHNYFKQYALPALSIRPFNIYGPGQVGSGAVHHFIARALRNQNIEIHGDGSQIRAWCFIDDIVQALLLCLEKRESVGHAFNIGNPRSVCTIYDLARHVLRLSGSSGQFGFVTNPNTDVELRVPNIDKARQILGFEPRTDLEEGLRRTIEWYRARLAP